MMVGPGDEIAPRGGGHGYLRASDSDREHVIDVLKAAYVHGLVTKDEFDARVGQTFASRTRAELAVLTADIPAGLAGAQHRPRLAPAQGNAPAYANVRPGGRAIMATAVFGGLALVISVSADPFASLAAFLLLIGGTGSAFVSLLLLGSKMRSQSKKRSRGQLPPQRGIDTDPGVPGRAISAAWAKKLPNGSKSRRRSRANAAQNRILRPQVAS